ncbi:MAG: DUF1127 domain-containing protein [Rhodospirillales bacterium]|nr:DUF1127 domain-containing protein [Rhodospirillales bacterium]
MTTLTLHHKTTSHGHGGRIAHLFAALAEWNRGRRRRRELAAELASMSELELHDLGISRADFPAILDGSFRR